MTDKFILLDKELEGELIIDQITRNIYATDASVYQQIPQAVCHPKSVDDLIKIVEFCNFNTFNLTLRGSGTSLAGQAVGDGIIVDMSRYFTKQISFDLSNKRITVQPGVIRDELNIFLEPFGLFFGPNTSTSNRCNIGGMVGNNSSGTTSIKYGTTRDHVHTIKAILSDGSKVEFGPLTKQKILDKCQLNSLEGKLYQDIYNKLNNDKTRQLIRSEYPKSSIGRRNTGYALDALLDMKPFNHDANASFNFCQLLCGSEGTLAIITEIELNLSDLPPTNGALICAHFNDLKSTLEAVPLLMKLQPDALEMMDRTILNCTIGHPTYEKYREFVVDDPFAILMIELRHDDKNQLNQLIDSCQEILKNNKLAYAFPILLDEKITNAWNLRKAGLGLLANLPGDKKAVACIEDTAVTVEDLKEFILEFDDQMRAFNQEPVYYAHAGAGELHIRPILNLKDPEDLKDFRSITLSTAQLVKRYRGSLSGEHGDGRVRGEFIPIILGEEVYQILIELKNTWDPNHIFNPGKIVNSPPMDEDLRTTNRMTPEYETIYDFSDEMGIVRAVEKCNGSGDCRKSSTIGGIMCPSYMASKDEKMTTRARANMLRIVLNDTSQKSPFNNSDLKSILNQCLSCKGCLSECPSNVDMTAFKTEANYQFYKNNSRPIQDYFFGFTNQLFKMSSKVRLISNLVNSTPVLSSIIKRVLHIHPSRKIPEFTKISFKITDKIYPSKQVSPIKEIFIFADEFTRYHEPQLIDKAISILNNFGYTVKIAPILDSARSQLSKGFLKEAKTVIRYNVGQLKELITENTPLLGIEPSCILGFRDEYPKLLRGKLKDQAKELAKNCYTLDEFILQELKCGNIKFSTNSRPDKHIKIHTHCHQKALSENNITEQLLAHFPNLHVEKIPSGCCGMAGSFGYDKNNYELSMNIGELILFPTVRSSTKDTQICANGTSCRHQIEEGTGRNARHIVEILYDLVV